MNNLLITRCDINDNYEAGKVLHVLLSKAKSEYYKSIYRVSQNCRQYKILNFFKISMSCLNFRRT